jgi:hypothetical protein
MDRGVVVDPLDTEMFSSVMVKLAEDGGLREELGRNALVFMRNYPDWEMVGKQAVLEARLV